MLMRRIWGAIRANPYQALTAACAIALLVELLVVFAQRLVYPFELEWMEGGTVTEIQVILAGRPLYQEPSLPFTPFLYPPLYYYVSAALARMVGVGLFAPRLVSILSTLGSMTLVARLVRAEGGRPLAVLIAVSFVAIGFQRSGFFMDLARVDSLFVFVGLAAFAMLRLGTSSRSAVAAGLLFALSFFTKQTGLLLTGAVVAGALFGIRKRAIIAGVTAAVAMVTGFLALNAATDGWFHYYAFNVASAHAVRRDDWWALLRASFWEPLPIVFGFALTAFFTGAFKERRAWMYAGLCLGALAGGYTSLMKVNGFINGIMPWLVYLSIAGGMGVEAALQAATEQARWRYLALSLVMLQWLVVLYQPRDFLPGRRDSIAGKEMLEKVRRHPGPILAFNANYWVAMAGRSDISAHTMALLDIFDQKDPTRTAKLSHEIHSAIESGQYATIITDDTTDWLPGVMDKIRAHYREEPAFDRDGTWTKTGVRARPKSFWTRR